MGMCTLKEHSKARARRSRWEGGVGVCTLKEHSKARGGGGGGIHNLKTPFIITLFKDPLGCVYYLRMVTDMNDKRLNYSSSFQVSNCTHLHRESCIYIWI